MPRTPKRVHTHHPSPPLAAPLLRWFRRHKRDLPWRGTSDPYRVWISEIMLQQTQVKTVIPYYKRWFQIFPDVQTLATAPFDRVLKMWEGLGYYRRARHLHEAAKLIVKKHDGTFPKHFNAVLALPGIGRYTAGAICSIAFGTRVPILDGNVIRVLCRYFGIRENARTATTQKKLWAIAESLLPESNVGEFNESLMELGALVCLPQNPNCDSCPLRKGCVARNHSLQHRLPNLGKRSVSKQVTRAAVVVCNRNRLLLCRDKSKTLLGDLWRLPFIETKQKEKPRQIEHRFSKELNLPVKLGQPIAIIRHTVTNSRITLIVWKTSRSQNSSAPPSLNRVEWKWCNTRVLKTLASDAATKRILTALPYLNT